MGVPELWRFDGANLHVLRLGRGKIYKPADSSGVFPFLRMKEFEGFLLRLGRGKQLPVLEQFQRWVKASYIGCPIDDCRKMPKCYKIFLMFDI